MEGVRLGKEELIRTYGVSQRLAVRLGALLAKGLEVSATLLEIAGPGSPVEKLLLHPDILAQAETLHSELVNRVARETGAAVEGQFIVAPTSTGRAIALAEEMLAEQGWCQSPEKAPTAITRAEAPPQLQRLLGSRETREIFSAEEIARIKLDALAGRDADARISALRKLVFAPIPAQEKGAIFLRALLDSALPVRAEAVKAIESLGFDRDTADAMQSLFKEDPRARQAALRRIGDLLGRLKHAERQVVLAVLVEVLRETRPTGPDDPMFQLFHQMAPMLVEQQDIAPEVVRVCVRHLIMEPLRLGAPLRELLLRLASAAPLCVLSRLWQEISTVTEPAPRASLLEVLMDTERDPERLPMLCDAVVQELLREGHDELTRRKLGHRLATLGLPAAQAMLRRFESAPNQERAILVPFIDALASERGLPPSELNEAARLMLNALKGADRRLRAEILRARLFLQEGIKPALRRDLARELTPMLRVTDSPEVAARAGELLEGLGEAAAEDLFDLMRARPSSKEADHAARIIGRILSRAGGSVSTARLAGQVLRFMCRRVALPSNTLGGYAAALGDMAQSSATSPDCARSALDLLLKRLGRVRYHEDLVGAIGRIAASSSATAQQRVQAANVLLGLVERPRDDDVLLRQVSTPKGKQYEIAGRIEFDSETLPSAVLGLETIALSDSTPPGLRRQILERLLIAWADVAEWKVVWGPRASEALARALGNLSADSRCEDSLRARTIAALALGLERLPVVRALHHVFETSFTGEAANKAAVEASRKVLDHWIQPEIAREELQVVLNMAAAACCLPGIAARRAEVRNLRERTLRLLFDALQNGYPWAHEPLARMAACPAMPRKMRKDIADRLKQAAASVLPLPARTQ